MENILPRREARENAFLLAFSQTFGDVPLQEALDTNNECGEERPVDVFGQRLLSAYYSHSAEVDDLIRDHLRNWTMERLPRVSLTVLRLALAEMLYGDERKPGVVINEAVELTKKYGADEDYQFVNGLLGAVAREQGLDRSRWSRKNSEPLYAGHRHKQLCNLSGGFSHSRRGCLRKETFSAGQGRPVGPAAE